MSYSTVINNTSIRYGCIGDNTRNPFLSITDKEVIQLRNIIKKMYYAGVELEITYKKISQ